LIPSWTLNIGDREIRGTGNLHKTLWPEVKNFDTFSVLLGTTHLVVRPKAGRILKNLFPEFQGIPGELVWFRIMQMAFEEGKSVTRYCPCFGAGIKTHEGRYGVKVFPDGRVERGI